LGSIERNPSDEGISSMVDTWLMVQDIELDGERNRSVYVMKSRGMDHSKEVREFVITSEGITLIPIKKDENGIIVGSKRVAAEKKKEAMSTVSRTQVIEPNNGEVKDYL
jgi:circadian clock protein KaiC